MPRRSVTSSRIRPLVAPPSPSNAQREVSKPAYDPQSYIGRFKAHAKALPEDVVDEIFAKLRIQLEGNSEYQPDNAAFWEDVDFLDVPAKQPVRVMIYELLTTSVWERYQRLRVVPVLREGRIVSHAVFPHHLAHLEAELRAQEWVGWKQTLLLVELRM